MGWLGLDLGTGSLKAAVVEGSDPPTWVGEASYELDLADDRAEITPRVWWEAAGRALAAIPPSVRAGIEGVGLSGQMHGVVPVDDGNEPVGPAVLWPDRRATAETVRFAELERSRPGTIGNPVVPGMPGPVVAWITGRQPERWARCARILAPKDWLRSRITGEVPVVSDPSDASATLLYDVAGDRWSATAARLAGLDVGQLSPLVDAAWPAGTVSDGAAHHLGIPAGVPVATGAADTAAALVGLGIEGPGPVLVNIGTGAQVVAVVDRPRLDGPEHGLHQHRTAGTGGRWYVMAPVLNGGLALSWVRTVLGIGWDELFAEADRALAGWGRDPRFVPFLAGERDPEVGLDARGAWRGLSVDHDRAALVRAALVGVAGYLAVRVGLVVDRTGADRVVLSGGSTRNRGWVRLVATLLDRPVEIAGDPAASVRGAAVLAARSQGRLLAPPSAGVTVEPHQPHRQRALAARAAVVAGWR